MKSDQNTERRRDEVIDAFLDSDHGLVHDEALPVFEHGHWWINCGSCGAQWSVVDATGGDSVGGYGFEEVSTGDGSCDELTEE